MLKLLFSRIFEFHSNTYSSINLNFKCFKIEIQSIDFKTIIYKFKYNFFQLQQKNQVY